MAGPSIIHQDCGYPSSRTFTAPPLVGRYCLFVRFSREVTEIGFLTLTPMEKFVFFRSALLNDSNGRQTNQRVDGGCRLFICVDGDGQPRRFHGCLRVTRALEKQWGHDTGTVAS